MSRKIIQITPWLASIVALCDDGTVWQLSGQEWHKLLRIPDDPPPKVDFYRTELGEFPWSVRTGNYLQTTGATTFAELANLRKSQILGTQNIGQKTLNEIKEVLELKGLKLRD